MMPRFVKLISDSYIRSRFSSPSPKVNVGTFKVVKVGHAQSSAGLSSGGTQEENLAPLQSPYQQLADEGIEGSERMDVVRDTGSERTGDIELGTWDQLWTRVETLANLNWVRSQELAESLAVY